MKLKVIPEKGMLRFDFIPNDPSLMNKHQIDGVMVTIYRILEDFCPDFLQSVRVAQRNSSYELEYYKAFFNVPVELADTTSLIYNVKCKDHYKNAANILIKCEEELGRRFFINPLSNMLAAEFSDFSISSAVRLSLIP